METIQIGKTVIEKTAALAPMASIADRAYREIAKEFGAAYVVGELASAKALTYSDRKTNELLKLSKKERPGAVQLFGNDPETMAQGARIALQYDPDIIDINMGCPVPKVAGNGCGAALMKDPKLAFSIVQAVVKASSVPVTVKIRKGWDQNSVNAVSFAALMEEAGGRRYYCPWTDERPDVYRQGGLGHYPSGQGSGFGSGDRQRGHSNRVGRQTDVRGNGLRLGDGGKGKLRQSLFVFPNSLVADYRADSRSPVPMGKAFGDEAAGGASGSLQRRVHRHAGKSQDDGVLPQGNSQGGKVPGGVRKSYMFRRLGAAD